MDVRRHPITGEQVLYAPERAGRPNAFAQEGDGRCPFCPGNEEDTPPEISRLGDPWRVRVFPNKYPAAAGHEVIVETPRHDSLFETIDRPADIVRTWIERYRAHHSAAWVSIFRNDGERSGASLQHPHAQVIPLPFVPPRPRRHVEAFTAAAACPLCAAISTHRGEGLVTFENEHFVAFAPMPSEQVYEQWVVPKRHGPDMTLFDGEQVSGLASILQTTMAAARTVARSQNLILMNFRNQPRAHCYAQVVPRITHVAGFELGGGTWIDVVEPSRAADRLRGGR